MKKRIDQRGIVSEYSYDKVYNLTAKAVDGNSVVADANESFSYDGLGRRLTADKTEGGTTVAQTEFAYSDIGPVTDSNQTLFGGTKREIDYAYGQAGYLSSIGYPDGNTASITPDYAGRIDTISYDGSAVATYEYIGESVAQRSYPSLPSDVIYEPQYDNLGRITRASTYVDGGSDIADFHYSYQSDSDNIAYQKFDHRASDPCNVFGYDGLERLTAAQYGVSDNLDA